MPFSNGTGRSGGNQGRGGRGGGHVSQFDGTITAFGTDRFCSACGLVIKGFATAMLAKCPHAACGAPVPLLITSENEFNEAGFGRCRNCKSYLQRTDVHCQNCRHVNVTAKERMERLKRKALLEETVQLRKESKEKDAKIARLEAMNSELNAIVNRQEMENNEMDEQLSQIDEGSVLGIEGSQETQEGVGNSKSAATEKGKETQEVARGSKGASGKSTGPF